MDIKTVLIENKKHRNNSVSILASSGILIEKKYVLATSHQLLKFLQENSELVRKIEEGKLHFYTRKNIKFRILWENEEASTLNWKIVNLFGLFKCKNLNKFCINDFKDWCDGTKENNLNLKEFVSIFLILAVEGETVSEEDLKSNLHTWLINVSTLNINKCDRVLCMSNPFGSTEFLNSISDGIVSTMLNNSTLFLSDSSSAPGCEGGLVYIKENLNFPIGIIISPFNWWRKEWVGFTLIADIRPILCQLVASDIPSISSASDCCTTFSRNLVGCITAVKESFFNTLTCVNRTQRYSMSQQRMANLVYLDFKSKQTPLKSKPGYRRCILHIVGGVKLIIKEKIREDLKIRLLWKNKLTTARLVYKTPDDSVFDLAVVKSNDYWSSIATPDLTIVPYKPGNSVYCAGYPLLSTFAKPDGVTVTHGNISSSSSYMIQTTCGVYPGFSGGGVFSSNGILLGIIVCNTKLSDVDVIYPKYNMAIPFNAISEVIFKYLKTEDETKLTQLNEPNSEAKAVWWKLAGKL